MNANNQNQFEGSLEDRGLDPLLEELLGNVSPPDLQNRIQKRLREFDPTSPRAEDLIAATSAAEKDLARGLDAFVIAPPVQRLEAPVGSSLHPEKSGPWRAFVVCASLAASILLAAFLSQPLWNSQNSGNSIAGKQTPVFPELGEAHKNAANTEPSNQSINNAREKVAGSTNSSVTGSSSQTGDSDNLLHNNDSTSPEQIAANTAASSNTDTKIDQAPSASSQVAASETQSGAGNVKVDPIARPESIVANNPIATNITSKKLVRNEALPNEQIVSVIDRQMEHMWSSIGVKPERTVSETELINRITLAIVGRLPTSAEFESLKSAEPKKLFPTLVDRLLGSDEYAKHWAPLLAQHYLGFPLPSQRDQTPAQIAFVEWVESSLRNGVSIGELERQLFAISSASSTDPATTVDASKHWLIAAMERGEGALHDSSLAAQSGSKPFEPREAAVVALARHAMRLSNKSEMICSQCHNTNPTTESATANATKQETFWNTVASFSNVGTQWINDAKSIAITKANPFYFEDDQGKLTLATATLPNGEKLILNHESLNQIGDWFKESTEPRRAVVNVVWNELFEQPLVPVFGLSEQEGYRDRVDLCDLLAVQFNAHDGDLKTLLKWTVLSKPFRLERAVTDSPWYMRSSNSQIAAMAQRRRAFASFSHSTLPNVDSSSRLVEIRTLSKWLEKRDGSMLSNRTLAQPSISTVDASKSAANRKPNNAINEYSENQVRFLISSKAPYQNVASMASKMSDSKLDWQGMVEHAYLISEARMPSRREVEEASRILELSEQDKSAAFTMLLNAQLGCP